MKPQVMRAAAEAGADIWNDVTALTWSPDSPTVAAELGCPVVLMHMQGEGGVMSAEPVYGDVAAEVADYLAGAPEAAMAAGVGA